LLPVENLTGEDDHPLFYQRNVEGRRFLGLDFSPPYLTPELTSCDLTEN
jgi:hypothetical protein